MPPLRLTASIRSSSGASFSAERRTPAFSRRSSASGNRLPTVASRFSSGAPCATPMRKPASSAGSNGTRLLAGHHRVGMRARRNRFRHRPDGIERVGERKSAVGRDALAARLEAGDAAERSRDAGRAAGVAADGDLAHAVGGRHRAARGRAARRALAIRRIARRAEMRIGADAGKGKFRHVGLGDDDRARLAQPPHDGRIALGGLGFRRDELGAGARHLAGDVEQILDADDGAIEWPERNAVTRARVGRLRRGQRLLAIDGEAGARAFALRIGDFCERGVEAFACGRAVHGTDSPGIRL